MIFVFVISPAERSGLALWKKHKTDGRLNIEDMIAIQGWHQSETPGAMAQGDIFN